MHPDKGGSKDAFQAVLAAFEILSDPARKEQYDRRCCDLGVIQAGGKTRSQSGHTQRDATCRQPARRRIPRKHQKTAATAAGYGSTRVGHLLQQLHELLRILPAARRQTLLANHFQQKERLTSEAWLTTRPCMAQAGAATLQRRTSPVNCNGCDQSEAGQQLALRLGEGSAVLMPLVDGSAFSSTSSDIDDWDNVGGHIVASTCMGRSRDEVEGTDCRPLASCAERGLPQMRSKRTWPPIATPREEPCSDYASKFVRGISSRSTPFGTYYDAQVTIGIIVLRSRSTRDLPSALTHLVVLTSAKHRLKSCGEAALGSEFVKVVEATFREHSMTYDDLGLGIIFRLDKRFWLAGRVSTPLTHSLELAAEAVRRLVPHHGKVGHKGIDMLLSRGPKALQEEWEAFRTAYLDVCHAGGWDRERTAARLDGLHAGAEARRGSALEWWNRLTMAREDHRAGAPRGREPAACRVLQLLCRWRRCAAEEERRAQQEQRRQQASRRAVEAERHRLADLGRKRFADLTFGEILHGARGRGERQ